MNTREKWIKAAVEHRLLEIDYYSEKTRRELTRNRQVEPDFVGTGRNGINSGYWATFCHLRHQGPRCFQPETVLRCVATEKNFQPSPLGRWQEIINEYNRLGLATIPFEQ